MSGPPPRPTPQGEGPTERVREICSRRPAVSERQSHGETTFFVADKKAFAMMADHHHDERIAVWVAAGDGVQGHLTARDPSRYFRPPYVGGRGWVGCYLDGKEAPPDWGAIAELLSDAWNLLAPVRLREGLSD